MKTDLSRKKQTFFAANKGGGIADVACLIS